MELLVFQKDIWKKTIPEPWYKNGGTGDCEIEFIGTRKRNNKQSSIDCNQITSKRTGVRAYSFTKKVENNTSEDAELWTGELIGKMEKNY